MLDKTNKQTRRAKRIYCEVERWKWYTIKMLKHSATASKIMADDLIHSYFHILISFYVNFLLLHLWNFLLLYFFKYFSNTSRKYYQITITDRVNNGNELKANNCSSNLCLGPRTHVCRNLHMFAASQLRSSGLNGSITAPRYNVVTSFIHQCVHSAWKQGKIPWQG